MCPINQNAATTLKNNLQASLDDMTVEHIRASVWCSISFSTGARTQFWLLSHVGVVIGCRETTPHATKFCWAGTQVAHFDSSLSYLHGRLIVQTVFVSKRLNFNYDTQGRTVRHASMLLQFPSEVKWFEPFGSWAKVQRSFAMAVKIVKSCSE